MYERDVRRCRMGKAPNEATCIKLKATHLLLVVCTNDMPMTSKYLGMRSPNCLVRCTNRIISRCCSRKVHVSIDTLPSLNQGRYNSDNAHSISTPTWIYCIRSVITAAPSPQMIMKIAVYLSTLAFRGKYFASSIMIQRSRQSSCSAEKK